MRAERWFAALIAALSIAALERDADACGPWFPHELLADRRATLLDLDGGVFVEEVARLVEPPGDRFAYVAVEPPGARAAGSARERALYERGAAAFHAGDRAAAIDAFEALLALPAAERHHRSTWAAYMLGRLRRDPGDYARVRQLARGGYADALGLAASSLGQEAQLHLLSGEWISAIHLYAEQAAHGHPDGPTSLLFVARDAIAGAAEASLAADPLGERLLAIYLWTRSSELDPRARERLWSFLGRSSRSAGPLAAAAYRDGRFELAGAIAGRDPESPLALRVRAKLALRDGDTASADRLLARAESAGQCRRPDRVAGERATIALAEDRVTDAMDHAWRARGSYPDAIYLAERVLTLDELAARVDRMALGSLPDRLAARLEPDRSAGDDAPVGWLGERRLRAILARRLMRDGQHERALPYFEPERRGAASAYAAARAEADASRDPIRRARALFAASRIARTHGLEILGTTFGPDWEMHGGQLDPRAWPADPPAPELGAGEAARVAASAPRPERRFHYRHLASELAEQAADLLPRRSQAFSAALCHGARDIFDDDRARVAHLWRRHVDEGPAVPFTPTFGQSCPPPRFEDARVYLRSGETPPWVPIAWSLLAAIAGWLAYSARWRLLARRP